MFLPSEEGEGKEGNQRLHNTNNVIKYIVLEYNI